MPIGYVIYTGVMAMLALSAVARHRPRRSSPFRLSYLFGFVLNWPLLAFVLLLASTVLAVAQSGTGTPVFRLGLGFAVLASVGLAVLRGRARGTGAALERALDEGLGPGWRDSVAAGLAVRLRRRPSLVRVLAAPISSRRRSVERIANIRYGSAGRGNLLDLYRDRANRSGRPVLIYLHGGAFRFGSKRFGARHLLYRLAGRGWLCVSANYSLIGAAGLADPLADVQSVIGWVREHAPEYGADPGAVFIAGSSAGSHLASLAALEPNDLAGVISLYGYYGALAPDGPPPPWFVAHGDQDTLVVVDDARAFVEQLRAGSPNPVVYAELPGAQHGFDLFRSRRFDTVVDAIEAFAAWVMRAHTAPGVALSSPRLNRRGLLRRAPAWRGAAAVAGRRGGSGTASTGRRGT